MNHAPIVIVGMGLAGTRCAATLRTLAPGRAVVLVGDEAHDPYERPPLSKELLARTREATDLTLPGARATQLAKLGIDARHGRCAVGIGEGRVELDDGSSLEASAIVLATGAAPRALPTGGANAHAHVLRSLDDALRLRERLRPGGELAIVGSGFVGAEVASTARAAGVAVTVIEAEPVPFARTLGATVGQWLAARWDAAGVDLRLGAGVQSIDRGTDGANVRIQLVDGSSISADDVLVAIGTVPRDELFHTAFRGIGTPGRGIPVDGSGATPVRGIWAAGDVALVSPASGASPRRIEHWTDAASAAVRVAHGIIGAHPRAGAAPYAWSDQFGVRLQVVGHPAGDLATSFDDRSSETLLARYLDADGRLQGIAAIGHPASVARYRGELAA